MRRIVALAWLLVAVPLALGGCHVEPTYGGKQVSCTTDAECRSQLGTGYTCQPAGYCARTGTSDGGVGDGGTTDGGTTDGGTGDGGIGDGGTPTCTPACQSGETCTDSGCVAAAGLAVTITAPADGDVVGNAVELHSQVAGAVGTPTVTCAVGSDTPVAATDQGGDWVCSLDLHALAEGAQATLTVRATDADNRSASDSVQVTHDSVPPTVSITAPTGPDGFYVPAPGALPVAATASDATLKDLALAYVDPAGTTHPVKDCPTTSTQASCSGSIALPLGSAPGQYELLATATDGAGQKKRAHLAFKIDGTPPTVGIAALPTRAVPRNQDVPITVNAADAETSVASVTLTLTGAGAGGADLVVPGTSTGTAGQTLFTVTRRGGTATPVLDAVEKTWPVEVVATDAWGNQATASGHLTITRVAWRLDLNAGGSTSGSALSPAVAADGTVYVVRQDGTGHDAVFAIPSGSGTPTEVATTARSVLAGPMLVEDASGVQQIILLETKSVTSTSYTLESLSPSGTQLWVYGQPATIGPSAYPLGLPALGSSGQLYVPVRLVPLVGNPAACIYQVALDGTNTDHACLANQTWNRAWIASLRQATGDTAVAVNAGGDALVASCAGTCGLVGTGTPIGTPAGGPMFSADHYFLVGATPAGGAGGSVAVGYPLAANLATDAPDWSVDLVGPTTEALRDGDRITGGLVGNLWEARGPTSPATPPNYTTLALPTGGSPASVSLGTSGRRYALVNDGGSAYVVAYAGPPDSGELWRFPQASAATSLPPPTSQTTAVLSPQGLLIVPDSKGGVIALVTDSLHPAVGWANVRADAARTASIAR